MVITKLMGGLGNQLFQYAAGRALSLRLNLPLKLDISMYEGPARGGVTPRVYELHRYNIAADIATTAEIAEMKQRKPSLLRRLDAKVLSKRALAPHELYYFTERGFAFDPEVMKINHPVYLEGHWQTANYFEEFGDVIRREFTLTAPPSGANAETLAQINSTASVALHIRRGDYANNPEVAKTHNLLPLSYYANATKLATQNIAAPHFYIFSDDPEWTKQNLVIDAATTYVTHNDSDHGYEDLRLMAACQHNIIANSSFSWWGAWLNANPQKQVYAPQEWFANQNLDTKDVIPASWTKVSLG